MRKEIGDTYGEQLEACISREKHRFGFLKTAKDHCTSKQRATVKSKACHHVNFRQILQLWRFCV